MNNIIFKTTFLKGEDGNNILRIDKTSTSGLVDTYTITLTDGTTTTFNVTNGSSIATIEKTATVGMVDTYTITLTDGSTSTFEVTNGANVTIDDHLDANSTNPVQNKVVNGAINSANNYDNTTSGLTATTKQGAIDELALDLNGFKFYPTGTNLVALVADDSYYTDTNGNYVLADSTTGESLIDDITYKSLASNEDLRGKVGADTAVPFYDNSYAYLKTLLYMTKLYKSGISPMNSWMYTESNNEYAVKTSNRPLKTLVFEGWSRSGTVYVWVYVPYNNTYNYKKVDIVATTTTDYTLDVSDITGIDSAEYLFIRISVSNSDIHYVFLKSYELSDGTIYRYTDM